MEPTPERSAAPLESPTGSRAVRGPTAFVLGLVIALATASIVRSLTHAPRPPHTTQGAR